MRSKEFTKEAGIEPIQPIATNKNTAGAVPQASATVAEPAGDAPVDQAIAQANQPKAPGFLSKLGAAVKAAPGRFAQGMSHGVNSALSSTPDALSKAGVNAAFAADVAKQQKDEAPYKQAFQVFAKQANINQVDPAMINKVRQILQSQYPEQAGWLDHVRKNTTPWDTQAHPEAGTATGAVKRVGPNDVAAYLKTAAKGQPVNSTGNTEIDKLMKMAGIQK